MADFKVCCASSSDYLKACSASPRTAGLSWLMLRCAPRPPALPGSGPSLSRLSPPWSPWGCGNGISGLGKQGTAPESCKAKARGVSSFSINGFPRSISALLQERSCHSPRTPTVCEGGVWSAASCLRGFTVPKDTADGPFQVESDFILPVLGSGQLSTLHFWCFSRRLCPKVVEQHPKRTALPLKARTLCAPQ